MEANFSSAHSSAMQKLIVEEFPLAGQKLIEASAGTGKTFTIAGLYNRLVLGHRHSPLDCTQILVVTFTRAATEELRGRLRARLNDSLQAILQLKQGVEAKAGSDLAQIKSYLAAIETANPKSTANLSERLKHNIALMDEASIYTIHGFCQRMLKQFAFDTGVLFSAEMELDTESYLQQACEDVWRQVAYGLDKTQSHALLQFYASPTALQNKIKSRFNKQGVQILPRIQAQNFTEAWQQFTQVFAQAKDCAANTTGAELEALIQASGLKKQSYSKRNTPNWIQQTLEFLQQEPSLKLPTGVNKLTPAAMLEKLNTGGALPEHELFNLLEKLEQAAAEFESFMALAWFEPIKTRFFEILSRAGVLVPNDLMRLLHAALTSEQGEVLAAQIRSLYPVAMIDEFQDTDALQYAIFNRIYPDLTAEDAAEKTDSEKSSSEKSSSEKSSSEKNASALIMIGDPKQAIYGFRGADIFTYIRAKQNLPAESCFTLDTNYRSHSQLIAGVNALFAQHPEPFVYQKHIQFEPAQAGGQQDDKAFNFNGKAQCPTQIFFTEEAHNNEGSLQLASVQCAQKIAELLRGEAYLGQRLVQARDLAVLVRTSNQANLIREALQREGVNSVFLVKDSVFGSPEAQELYHWLNAVAHPSDERLLRRALSGAVQNFSAEHLAHLLVDESLWEQALEQNQHYHQVWQRQGMMAAVLLWLETDGLAQKIRQQPRGERVLTNLMHLGDLLQTASRQLHGPEALLRWLAERVFGEEDEGEGAQLRLESDADLVSIVTIHSSKGLQYPLVFLPFLWHDQNTPFKGEDCVFYDEEKEQVILHLAPEDKHQSEHLKASLAENMRLLYVAVTRAEQGCFIWLMNNTSNKKSIAAQSALGRLLQVQALQGDLDISELYARFQAFNSVYLGELPDWSQLPARKELAAAKACVQVPSFSAKPALQRYLSSYSSLAKNVSTAESLVELKEDESSLASYLSDYLPENLPEPAANSARLDWPNFDSQHFAFQFQKGPQAGNCLHDILEDWDFRDAKQLQHLCEQKLHYYGLSLPEEQVPLLADWLQACVNTPLFTAQPLNPEGESMCLAKLQPQQRLSEMEFHLPVKNLLQAQDLDRLLGAGARFNFVPLQGFLKGFIDLIFEHQGRFYVADYKSNFLGTEAADYLGQSLEQAMLAHAYDLQAWIYTLALDAFLRLRLGENYQPEQHLGGVFYFFLRAMHLGEASHKPVNHGQMPGVYFQAPDLMRLEQWREVFFAQEASA